MRMLLVAIISLTKLVNVEHGMLFTLVAAEAASLPAHL